MHGSFYFSNMFFGSGCVHNNIFHLLSYSLVKLHFNEDSFYYHATSGIDFHEHFKYLLNLLAIKVGTCSTGTKVIPQGMSMNNIVPLTNITYAMRVTNL